MAYKGESSKSGRKQWKIGVAPVGRLSGLSLHAEDGSPDTQVVMAKRLLEEDCGEDIDQEQNARLGVYWLIKASERGHKEATNMLRKCLESGRGINQHNISDVRTCLNMSAEEKVSRHAARELFASLSQGEDFITSEQLLQEIARTQRTHGRREDINNCVQGAADGGGESFLKPGSFQCYSGKQRNVTIEKNWEIRNWVNNLRTSSSGEKLTEDVLVSAASYYSRGELPIVHRSLMLSSTIRDNRRSVSRSSALLAPFLGYYSCIVRNLGEKSIRSFMPVDAKCLQTLFLLLLYSLFGLDGLMDAMPTLLYYTSLLLMILTTCKILVKKWEFNHFKEWSNLLVAWGGPGVNAENAQWTNCYNNIHPCFLFLFALIFNIVITPFVPIFNIPYSEIVILSTILAFITLYNFAWNNGKLDVLAIISFGISLLASYPWEIDTVVSKSWRFLDVNTPTFISHLVGNSIEFCLNFRLLFCLIKPVLLIKMAARDRWRGFYYNFVPHLISLSWWQMAVITSNGATSFGLIRGCLAIVGVLILIPLSGMAMMILPIAAVLRLFLNTESVVPISASFIGAAVSLAVLVYLKIRRSFTGHLATAVQVILLIISSAVLISSHLSMNRAETRFGESATSVSYVQVQTFCSPSKMLGTDIPPVGVLDDERCATLNGIHVHWEGRISSARISKIHNPINSIIHYLPVEIQRVALCMYGVKYDECDGKEDCRLPVHLSNRCHVANWNRYEYEIIVSLSTGRWDSDDIKITLKGDNNFRNFTRNLHQDDKIWFSGRLIVDPTLPKLEQIYVRLEQAGCLVCKTGVTPVLTGTAAYGMSDLLLSGKHFLNFLFNPLVRFK
uniref:Uncharacterized protein n=1 Tax=Rhodnius prolixus TaxID=13249 RepID=T1I9F3_RHOPR